MGSRDGSGGRSQYECENDPRRVGHGFDTGSRFCPVGCVSSGRPLGSRDCGPAGIHGRSGDREPPILCTASIRLWVWVWVLSAARLCGSSSALPLSGARSGLWLWSVLARRLRPADLRRAVSANFRWPRPAGLGRTWPIDSAKQCDFVSWSRVSHLRTRRSAPPGLEVLFPALRRRSASAWFADADPQNRVRNMFWPIPACHKVACSANNR